MPPGQDELGIGLFDGLKEAAFEDLAALFDACFEVLGEMSVLLGQRKFQADLSLKDETAIWIDDVLGRDRGLNILRDTHGMSSGDKGSCPACLFTSPYSNPPGPRTDWRPVG